MTDAEAGDHDGYPEQMPAASSASPDRTGEDGRTQPDPDEAGPFPEPTGSPEHHAGRATLIRHARRPPGTSLGLEGDSPAPWTAEELLAPSRPGTEGPEKLPLLLTHLPAPGRSPLSGEVPVEGRPPYPEPGRSPADSAASKQGEGADESGAGRSEGGGRKAGPEAGEAAAVRVVPGWPGTAAGGGAEHAPSGRAGPAADLPERSGEQAGISARTSSGASGVAGAEQGAAGSAVGTGAAWSIGKPGRSPAGSAASKQGEGADESGAGRSEGGGRKAGPEAGEAAAVRVVPGWPGTAAGGGAEHAPSGRAGSAADLPRQSGAATLSAAPSPTAGTRPSEATASPDLRAPGPGPRLPVPGSPVVEPSPSATEPSPPGPRDVVPGPPTASIPRIYGGQHRDPRRFKRLLRIGLVLLVVVLLLAGWVVDRAFLAPRRAGSVGTSSGPTGIQTTVAGALLSVADRVIAEQAPLALRLDIAAVALDGGSATTEHLARDLSRVRTSRVAAPDVKIVLDEGAGSVIALRADRGLVASGGDSGTVVLQTPDAEAQVNVPLPGATAAVTALRFRPDGHALAVGRADGRVDLLDVTDARDTLWLSGVTAGGDAVSSLSFGPDGHHLAAACDDGEAVVWTVTSPVNPLRFDALTARTLAITGDGARIVVGGNNGLAVYVIGTSGLTRRASVVTSGEVKQLTLDAAGMIAVTVSPGGAGAVWDVSGADTPTLAARLDVPGGKLQGVAMSPAGPLLVGMHTRGMLSWDLSRPGEPAELASLGSGAVPSALGGFSSDGTWLLTVTGANAQLWHGVAWLTPGADQVRQACTFAGGGLDPQQWQIYLPNVNYRDTCAD